MAAANRSHTFISYSRRDGDFALRLAEDLRAAGADIWIDQLDIEAGTRWDEAIEDATESCESFVIILSPDSVASHNVRDELAYALKEGKRVIPALHIPCRIPLSLTRIQYIDFATDYDQGLTCLARILGGEHETLIVDSDLQEDSATQQELIPKHVPGADVWTHIVDVTASLLGVDQSVIVPEASFVDDLNADELDIVELVMAFEEAFGIEIPDKTAEALRTVGDVYEYVINRTST